MRVPWTAKRTHLSILKEINPECSLEGQILKLRLQYFGHIMRKENSLEKTLMLGKCEGKRRRGRQRTRWLDGVIEATNMNLIQLREAVEDRRAWLALVHGVMKSRIQQQEHPRKWQEVIHAFLYQKMYCTINDIFGPKEHSSFQMGLTVNQSHCI